jgi:UMF1 family MFS transporter
VAVTSPFLGAGADRMGHRKPALALVVAIMAVATFLQWWILPADAGWPLWGVASLIIVAGVSYSWTEVLHNAMLTVAAKPSQVSQVSGLGLSLGNLGSVLLLIFVLAAFALPGNLPIPGLPSAPLFGLNPATHEPARIVTPIAAVWLVVFSLPLFLFTPDRNASGEPIVAAFRDGLMGVVRTVAKLFRDYRNVALFLIARMLYVDGTTAIVIFGGIYPSGVFHWGLVELLAFGVILSIFAVGGGFLSAWLDHKFGPKRAVAAEIGVTLACLVAMVSMSPSEILFFIPVEPGAHVWVSPIFPTAPELAYLAVSIVIAISITGAYASSRGLMARFAPAGMEGELFGLYALSSSATSWLAPLLIGIFTATFASQRVGFASIAILLVVGLALLMLVKPPAKHA